MRSIKARGRVDDAVHAALAIVKNVKALDLAQLRESGATLSPSVGVHHGTAVAGVAGSGDLLEYTVLGNTVNLAARVETLTRFHDAVILVTETVKERLDPGFEFNGNAGNGREGRFEATRDLCGRRVSGQWSARHDRI